MKYPGLGDPAKRKKTFKFLAITGIIALTVGISSSLIQGQLSQNDPLKVCINDRDTRYVISVKLELYVDKNRAEAVRDYLISIGVNPDRLKTEGYGEERPLTDNDTIEGRLTNRRVQFRAEF